ncbi:hypothetical protein Micbo1qcDRAFT_159273, partial [Microdochium bolleyi]
MRINKTWLHARGVSESPGHGSSGSTCWLTWALTDTHGPACSSANYDPRAGEIPIGAILPLWENPKCLFRSWQRRITSLGLRGGSAMLADNITKPCRRFASWKAFGLRSILGDASGRRWLGSGRVGRAAKHDATCLGGSYGGPLLIRTWWLNEFRSEGSKVIVGVQLERA